MQKAQINNFEPFDASDYKVGLICAQFNSDITNKILTSALEKLDDYQVASENIEVRYVAGSVEIPVILRAMAKTKKYDCLIAIGVIIRGQTDHYHYVAKIAMEGINKVMLDYGLPIGLAVLTTPNKKLAAKRITIGTEAVKAALNNAKIISQIG